MGRTSPAGIASFAGLARQVGTGSPAGSNLRRTGAPLRGLRQKPGCILLQNYGNGENPRKEVVFMNALVAYFSAAGTTAKAAKLLAEAVGADLYEIRPAVPYTSADLNWMNKSSRSSLEMQDKHSRPALADTNAPVADHDVIFLGFPVWWYVAPTLLNTFLEAYDFTGKTIVLFATSGGSGLGKAAQGLQVSAPGARILDGRLLNGKLDKAELKQWAESLGL